MGTEMTPATMETSTTASTPIYKVSASSKRDTRALSQTVVAHLSTPCNWLMDVLYKIDSLPYGEANWDSYGARPVSRSAGEIAKRFSGYLSQISGMEGRAPTISAAPSGEVLLCWDVGDWSMDVTINETGWMDYVYLDHHDSNQDREGTTSYLDEIIALLTQLPR